MDYENSREEYSKYDLKISQLADNPLVQLEKWVKEAVEAGQTEPFSMVLSTVNKYDAPRSRVVLMKSLDKNGITFFTNYYSDKGVELQNNSSAALLFFWPLLERQVRIEANVEKLPVKESNQYFYSRPFESQVGAVVSPQSRIISSVESLEIDYKREVERLRKKGVSRPNNWGGYLTIPFYFEFWQGRPGRLHRRYAYSLDNKKEWIINTLAP
ncbi:pyridoxamine 5'-phosphate oxidase [Marinilabiliaceae bacterium ANBcel2]|nr:pyridoxamine 5'-phosphate oxidase [Marinilabiliaceae bacterium ANBcel2]